MTLDVSKLRQQFEGPHHLITTSDSQTLFLRKWEPYGEIKRKQAVLILHGITAHSGPYSMIGEPLAKSGFTVYGLDLRGHGLSDGVRGDYPSKDRFVKDICETIAFTAQLHNTVVLLGHSLGVLSSVLAMSSCLENIDGVILLSGARTIRPEAYPQISVLQKLKIALWSLFSPSKPVIKYGRDGMVGLDDQLFNFRYTLRFMRIANIGNIEVSKELHIPFFVGIGDSDELFSVDSCREIFEEIPSDSKEFHVFLGGKHAEFPEGSWVPLVTWLEKTFN
ncbi:MAG: alpha/beta fold hydrolase [Candidatus Thorarchaeota archaeon]|nr:alpha/beta fold hydrolase [Candidatus Thorarchaeota archaeon]